MVFREIRDQKIWIDFLRKSQHQESNSLDDKKKLNSNFPDSSDGLSNSIIIKSITKGGFYEGNTLLAICELKYVSLMGFPKLRYAICKPVFDWDNVRVRDSVIRLLVEDLSKKNLFMLVFEISSVSQRRYFKDNIIEKTLHRMGFIDHPKFSRVKEYPFNSFIYNIYRIMRRLLKNY